METNNGKTNAVEIVEHSGCNMWRRFFRKSSEVSNVKQDSVEQLLLDTIDRLEKVEKKQSLGNATKSTAVNGDGQMPGKAKKGVARLWQCFTKSGSKKKDKKKSKKNWKKNIQKEVEVKAVDVENNNIEIVDSKDTDVKCMAVEAENKESVKDTPKFVKDISVNYALLGDENDNNISSISEHSTYKQHKQKVLLQWALNQKVTSDYEKILISVMKDLDAAGDFATEPRPINKIYAKSCGSLPDVLCDYEEDEYMIDYESDYIYGVPFEPVLTTIDEVPELIYTAYNMDGYYIYGPEDYDFEMEYSF